MTEVIRALRQFRVSTVVQMGVGSAAGLLDVVGSLGGSRLTVVTDRGVQGAGIVDRVLAPLIAAGIPVDIDDTAQPNPKDVDCEASAARATAFGADLIVGIGGGSPLDAAKTVAMLMINGGAARDWGFTRPFDADPLPLIAIPTTAGTGSEVTTVAVVTDTARKFKMTLGDPRMAPAVALVDPDLTMSVPPATTAATGMDALTHAIEAYTCRVSNPVSDALALRAMRMTAANVEAAVRDGSDRAAREAMLTASTLAGMAFGNADVAAVHCISEAIGGLYDTPHGVANSVFLPIVFAHNIEADPARHADVAECLGVIREGRRDEHIAQAGAERLTELSCAVGIPRLRDLPHIDPVDFPRLAAASLINGSTPSNARELTEADYLHLLERAYEA